MRSLLAACVSWLPMTRAAAAELQVVAHVEGRHVELPADRVAASGLVALCEAQARSAGSVLRLAVSADTIAAQRREALALEILYPAPRQFVMAAGNRSLTVSRLLIPLSGELSGSMSTIFWGNPNYESGPLRNALGTAELARLVQTLLQSVR
jgi:hypothetical protein